MTTLDSKLSEALKTPVYELAPPVTRISECEYEFTSEVDLSRLSNIHGSIPDFEKVSGSENRYRTDAVAAIKFVTESSRDLLEAVYLTLPQELRSALPFEQLNTGLPSALEPSQEQLFRNRGESFTAKDLLDIKNADTQQALISLYRHLLAMHVGSRAMLLSSEAALPTTRILEGMCIGDVIKTVLNRQPVMAVVTAIELDYGNSGPIVSFSFGVLGASIGRSNTALSWQISSTSLSMRRRTKVRGVLQPVSHEQFVQESERRVNKAIQTAEALVAPKCVQLSKNAIFFQKKLRQAPSETPVSGRAIIDPSGFQLNASRHSQEVPFFEISDDNFDGQTLEERIAALSPYSACLAPAIPAYSLMTRKWGFVTFSDCEPITYRQGLMEMLVVEQSSKKLLLSLTNCFTNGRANRQNTDFVEGKEGGNVFLLHGPSGIGKTLTAEATAESLRRPLYRVSAAELGTTPEAINVNLELVLANSSRWGAVTLLDEADIFLEARTTDDISRNAIVGIFLQTLEYSSGVLFITTNRVTNLDPAILPRISLGFSYPTLSADARKQVWKNLLGLRAHTLTEVDFHTLAENDFNGRQIKNVVNMASTLAAGSGEALDMTSIQAMVAATATFIAACRGKEHTGQ